MGGRPFVHSGHTQRERAGQTGAGGGLQPLRQSAPPPPPCSCSEGRAERDLGVAPSRGTAVKLSSRRAGAHQGGKKWGRRRAFLWAGRLQPPHQGDRPPGVLGGVVRTWWGSPLGQRLPEPGGAGVGAREWGGMLRAVDQACRPRWAAAFEGRQPSGRPARRGPQDPGESDPVGDEGGSQRDSREGTGQQACQTRPGPYPGTLRPERNGGRGAAQGTGVRGPGSGVRGCCSSAAGMGAAPSVGSRRGGRTPRRGQGALSAEGRPGEAQGGAARGRSELREEGASAESRVSNRSSGE